MVVDQIRCIGQDAKLRAEILRQGDAHIERSLGELRTEQRQLEKQMARHHAEIQKLVVAPKADSTSTARVVELHSQVERDQQRLNEIREQSAAVERERINANDISAAFADFDNVWSRLSSREQAAVMRLLVARAEYEPRASSISITFHPTAIRTLATLHRKDDAA